MRSDRLGETLLPKQLALPVFASDALSSVAYAPDEILLTLGLARRRLALTHSWRSRSRSSSSWSSSSCRYRQNVHAYPSRRRRLRGRQRQPRAAGRARPWPARCSSTTCSPSRCRSRRACRTPASAVRLPARHGGDRRGLIVVLLTAMNLRGVRESGAAFAVPTYLFMIGVIGMAALRLLSGRASGDLPPRRERAVRRCIAETGYETHRRARPGLPHAPGVLVRAVRPSPASRRSATACPRSRSRSARTPRRRCCSWAASRSPCSLSMIALSRWTGVKIAEDPATQLTRDGVPVGADLRAGHRDRPGVARRCSPASRSAWSSCRSSPA